MKVSRSLRRFTMGIEFTDERFTSPSDKGNQKERAVQYRAFNRLGLARACWHARISYGAMLLQRL